MIEVAGEFAVPGAAASGEALVLSAPISFWGGVDPKTGIISDVRHPQHGLCVTDKVVFIPGTIGSSSASAVLLELVYAKKAPAAIIMHEPDAILLLGLVAARELGLAVPPALILDRAHHGAFSESMTRISKDGVISVAGFSDQ